MPTPWLQTHCVIQGASCICPLRVGLNCIQPASVQPLTDLVCLSVGPSVYQLHRIAPHCAVTQLHDALGPHASLALVQVATCSGLTWSSALLCRCAAVPLYSTMKHSLFRASDLLGRTDGHSGACCPRGKLSDLGTRVCVKRGDGATGLESRWEGVW
jgi:hypothetical protein